ncbi:MAG TPA: hypothetical protein ENN05_02145 [Deltaproteobacteria bacterium]|nr:hypothetical protein [Deltaproteobacteria bacterium]
MSSIKTCITRITIILFLAAAFSGCAFGNFGKANMSYSDINVPSGLVGVSKADVIKTMGVPNSVAVSGKTEYWGFNNQAGFYVILFGKTIEKDVVLEIVNGKVASSYLVDKGSSIGIFTGQGAIAQ